MTEPRLIEATTTINGEMVIGSVSLYEEMSKPFTCQVEFVSTNVDIKPGEAVGQPFAITISRSDKGKRYIHGLIKSIAAGPTVSTNDKSKTVYRNYRVEIVPWLWFLTQTARSYIFFNGQKNGTNVKDVIAQVLKRAESLLPGRVAYDDKGIAGLAGRKLEHCVQYRETDFNFLSRILEQFGVFYYFRHEQNQHTLVLENSTNYPTCAESEVKLPMSTGTQKTEDYLTSWEHQYDFIPGKFEHRDFDFEKSMTQLLGQSGKLDDQVNPLGSINDNFEIYDFPGEFTEGSDAKEEARIRIEAEEIHYQVSRGSGTCKSFTAGYQFKLNPPDDATEAEAKIGDFLITSITHHAAQPGPVSGSDTQESYQNSFNCIPASQQFRPSRITAKPLIAGLQTATVVGTQGEEIETDEYGRVRVHFHWDREGWANSRRIKEGEKFTCMIRVAQSIAGNGWGSMAIPRIGQEVIVEFVEGDPDRPVITGSLYNDLQKVPYDLPANKAKSCFKSNSTLGGEGYNEWMFDDAAGKERVYFHAQKDMDFRVRNDFKSRVYGNYHTIIGWEHEGKKGGDRRELVWEDNHQTIKRNQIEHVHGNHQLMIGNGDADEGGNLDLVVEKKKTEQIEGDSDLTVGGNHSEKIDGNLSSIVGGHHHTKVNGNVAVETGATGELHVKSGLKIVLEAGQQLSIVGPSGFIDIGPAGITIEGAMVKINCGGGQPAEGSGVDALEPEEAQRAEPAEPAHAWNSKGGAKSAPDPS